MALEVCVENVASAVSAWRGGAKRLELCSSLSLGGLTPSLGLFRIVRKAVPPECLVFVMIRAKQEETYVYDESELDVMVEDINIFKQNGADGFVFGCLNERKEIDIASCKKLLKASGGFPCTFHRAFDVVKNPEDSLATLINLGFSRVLTSGQADNVLLGRHLIKKLVLKAKELGSDLIVVAGGGISPDNLKEVLETTKVSEYHGSARSNQGLPNEQLNISYVTDETVVRKMVEICENSVFKKEKN